MARPYCIAPEKALCGGKKGRVVEVVKRAFLRCKMEKKVSCGREDNKKAAKRVRKCKLFLTKTPKVAQSPPPQGVKIAFFTKM